MRLVVQLAGKFGANLEMSEFRQQSESAWLFLLCRSYKNAVIFRENRTSLLCAFDSREINEVEFVLLYDLNTAKSPDLPYWNYEHFDLDNLADDVCKAEFRFNKNGVCNLMEVLHLPDEFTCYNGLKIDGLEGFCVLLKLFAFPCRYLDMIT